MQAGTDAAVAALIRAQHCGQLSAERVPGVVAAQRVRGAALAQVIAREARAGRRVILIAGTEHVRRDRGVPLYLVGLPTGTKVRSVAGLASSDPVEWAACDDFLIAPAAARDDPCDAAP